MNHATRTKFCDSYKNIFIVFCDRERDVFDKRHHLFSELSTFCMYLVSFVEGPEGGREGGGGS